MKIPCGKRFLDCSQPRIMGVLNVTPDSFYDGGQFVNAGQLRLDSVLARVKEMIQQGADIIDVGGESTRPGAASVSLSEECDRVLPVVDAITERFDTIISIDTSSAKVIEQGARLGAGLINDVRALQSQGALRAAAESGLAVCLMHMQGSPESMQFGPNYQDAVADVFGFLSMRKEACLAVGVDANKIIFDPGIGFGKKDEHNLELLKNIERFSELGPVLLGVSRKSMFGRLLGRKQNQRLSGSLAVALIAAQKGVNILRVHDVAETRDVLKMYELICC